MEGTVAHTTFLASGLIRLGMRGPFIALIDNYERCFRDRDIARFRSLHVADGQFIFFDNHARCDSYSYGEHEGKIVKFFKHGHIAGLLRSNLRIFVGGTMACVITTHRYSSKPVPGVRTTYVLEREKSSWKIRHVHHSFDPNETAGA
jgi:hypothetical protein